MAKRIFDENDKHFECNENTGATRLHVDSCDCVVIYDKEETVIGVIDKCKLHKNIADKNILKTIKSHRVSNDLNDKPDDTNEDKLRRQKNRHKEKLRIKKII